MFVTCLGMVRSREGKSAGRRKTQVISFARSLEMTGTLEMTEEFQEAPGEC